MFYLYIALLLATIILANKYKIRCNKFAIFIIIVLACIMGASMRDGYDTQNFISSFDEIKLYKMAALEYISYAYSPMYFFITYTINGIGINSFYLFKFIVLLVCSFIICQGYKDIKTNYYFVLFLFLIGTYFDEVMQIRNTISIAIFIWGFQFLYKDGKNNILYYVATVLLASLNHISFLFSLVFLTIRLKRKRMINLSFYFGIILYLYTFIFRDMFAIMKLTTYFSGGKLENTGETVTRFGSFYIVFFYVVTYWLVNKCNKIIQDVHESGYDIYKSYSACVCDVAKMMSLFLFVSVTSLSQCRLYRDVNLLFLVEYSLLFILPKEYVTKRQFLLVICASTFVMFYWMYLGNFIQGPPEDIIYSVFNGNLNWF